METVSLVGKTVKDLSPLLACLLGQEGVQGALLNAQNIERNVELEILPKEKKVYK